MYAENIHGHLVDASMKIRRIQRVLTTTREQRLQSNGSASQNSLGSQVAELFISMSDSGRLIELFIFVLDSQWLRVFFLFHLSATNFLHF